MKKIIMSLVHFLLCVLITMTVIWAILFTAGKFCLYEAVAEKTINLWAVIIGSITFFVIYAFTQSAVDDYLNKNNSNNVKKLSR